MEPRYTSRSAPASACTPPKLSSRPDTARIVASCAPRAPAAALRAGAPATTSATEHHLLAPAEQALRAEGPQADPHEAHDHEAQGGDLRGRQGQVQEAGSLQQDPQDRGAGDDANVARKAAQDEHGVAGEGDARIELVRRQKGEIERQQVAG